MLWPERLSGRATAGQRETLRSERHTNLRGCVRATHQGAKGVAEGFDEVLVRVGPSSVTLKSNLEITLKTTTAAATFFEASTRDLVHGWKGGSRVLLGHTTRLVIGSEARGGRVRVRAG